MRAAPLRNLQRAAGLALLLLVLAWALRGTEFEPERLSGGLARAWEGLSAMFPPRWSELPRALEALVVTVQMALLGTFIGLTGALPVSFVAARTGVVPMPVSVLVKACLNVLRAIPPHVYAILFVYIAGLGPFTGALGIGVGAFAFMAKLFAESLESVHPAPVEAVRACGGNRAQVFAYGMLPQALPQFLSHTLYAWEQSISAATVVGIVGAGGIGHLMIQQIRYYEWQKASVYILVVVLMVLVADAASYRIRRRFT